MKSNGVKFLILAVAAFGLGGAFAYMQAKNNIKQPVVQQAAKTVVEAPPAATAVPAPAVEVPALEGVPPMPVPEAAPAAAADSVVAPAAPAVAGVEVGGAFSLVDHKGNPVTEKSWPGKYKLVFFGFTNCPDVCPAGLQKISTVMENYDEKGEKLVPLFITVDPARDTPAAMAAYVGKYNPNIIGLTGTEEQVKAAEDAYKAYAAKVPGSSADNYMMNHSGYIYLMSQDDKLLEVFDANETAENMIDKIRLRIQ